MLLFFRNETGSWQITTDFKRVLDVDHGAGRFAGLLALRGAVPGAFPAVPLPSSTEIRACWRPSATPRARVMFLGYDGGPTSSVRGASATAVRLASALRAQVGIIINPGEMGRRLDPVAMWVAVGGAETLIGPDGRRVLVNLAKSWFTAFPELAVSWRPVRS